MPAADGINFLESYSKYLPHIDVVLISHNHYDHLDTTSAKALNTQAGSTPLFVTPLDLGKWMKAAGITNVSQVDWWDEIAVNTNAGQVHIYFTPVQHWSARSLGDRRATLWDGYAVIASDFHMYFSGDTDYSKNFIDTREHFSSSQTLKNGGGFDIALFAVGAYEPRWLMKKQHSNPEKTVQIHLNLHDKRSADVHWGTFDLTDESLDHPPKDLALARSKRGLKQQDFDVIAIGEDSHTDWIRSSLQD